MNSGHCPKKDEPKAVTAGKVRAAEFKALQAANPGGGEHPKYRKRKTNKERMEKKIAVAVLKAQEGAAATAAAATTTVATNAAATASTPLTACVPPVPQVIVQPPCGPDLAFGGAASIDKSTLAPPGMQHYGPPQAYHNGRYSPHPSGYAVSVNQGRYHPHSSGCGRGGPHNLGCTVMILLQDAAGRKKPMLPAEIRRKLHPLCDTQMDWLTLVLWVACTSPVS